MEVALLIVKLVAATPPKNTADAVEKFVPVMVTLAPVAADVGVNEETVGAVDSGTNVKPLIVPVSKLGDVTATEPVPPTPTVAVMLVELTTV
jgi:hypothetical protein